MYLYTYYNYTMVFSMDIKDVIKITKLFNQSNFSHFSYKKNNFNLTLYSSDSETNHINSTAYDEIACTQEDSNYGEIVCTQETSKTHTIFSKYVGKIVFCNYKTSKPFVTLNKHVKKGDLLAIIKILNMDMEVFSPIDGVISDIYVEDNQFVEYNSKLFKLLILDTED